MVIILKLILILELSVMILSVNKVVVDYLDRVVYIAKAENKIRQHVYNVFMQVLLK
ncbi:MAG: hypothetical protein ACTS8R_06940 [Arsenophonus sp. NC-QC1-MAG3]